VKNTVVLIALIAQSLLCAQVDVIQLTAVNDFIEKSDLPEDRAIIVSYGLAEYLNKFLIDNIVNEETDIEFHDFRRLLPEEEQLTIFNEKEVKNLISQSNRGSGEFLYLLDLPSAFYSPKKAEAIIANNFSLGVPLDTGLSQLVLSYPLITADGRYILFAYSKKLGDFSSRGILLYRVQNMKVMFVGNLDFWFS
jgi:hypothetical protein